MAPRTKNRLLLVAAAFVVIASAAIEDWYGKSDFAADGINYLDLAQAVRSGDWASAASPYWSMGYPCFLAVPRGLFPPDATGEWTSLHVVNLFCFLLTYLSFLCFLSASISYAARINAAEENGPGARFVYIIGTSLFLIMHLTIGAVSAISPDLLVSGLFFLINALSIRFFLQPGARTALLLGLGMGIGYVIKAVFLPLSAVTFLALLLHIYFRRPADRFRAMAKLAWALPAIALIAGPCIVLTSHALGRFTLGETGRLNYAWSVDGLPHGVNWQGGPPPFGTPVHPTRLVGTEPPVFEFAEPFHATYPPMFNQFYWFDGYHSFFDLRAELREVRLDLFELSKCLAGEPYLNIKILAKLALFFSLFLFLTPDAREEWKRRVASIWPLYLPSLAGLLLYLAVVLEPRYVVSFLLILLVLPFAAFFVPTELAGKRFGNALAAAFVIGAAVIVGTEKAEIFQRASANQSYAVGRQWKVGFYLAQAGLRPGDKVASVLVGPAIYCTWAHVAGVHIVAEIGNNAFDPAHQIEDFRLFTGIPEIQRHVFQLFKQAGAVMVVIPESEVPPEGSGWEPVPETKAWVHPL
jgi:hypothetical protein